MTKKRNRRRQTTSLQDRLVEFANGLAQVAATMPAGDERDGLLKRARTAKIAADIDDWVSSAGLQPPMR